MIKSRGESFRGDTLLFLGKMSFLYPYVCGSWRRRGSSGVPDLVLPLVSSPQVDDASSYSDEDVACCITPRISATPERRKHKKRSKLPISLSLPSSQTSNHSEPGTPLPRRKSHSSHTRTQKPSASPRTPGAALATRHLQLMHRLQRLRNKMNELKEDIQEHLEQMAEPATESDRSSSQEESASSSQSGSASASESSSESIDSSSNSTIDLIVTAPSYILRCEDDDTLQIEEGFRRCKQVAYQLSVHSLEVRRPARDVMFFDAIESCIQYNIRASCDNEDIDCRGVNDTFGFPSPIDGLKFSTYFLVTSQKE